MVKEDSYIPIIIFGVSIFISSLLLTHIILGIDDHFTDKILEDKMECLRVTQEDPCEYFKCVADQDISARENMNKYLECNVYRRGVEVYG